MFGASQALTDCIGVGLNMGLCFKVWVRSRYASLQTNPTHVNAQLPIMSWNGIGNIMKISAFFFSFALVNTLAHVRTQILSKFLTNSVTAKD